MPGYAEQDYQALRSIRCGNGLHLVLARRLPDDQAVIMLETPHPQPESPPRFRHPLLAATLDVLALADGQFTIYAQADMLPLPQQLSALANSEARVGVACDLLELLVNLHAQSLALSGLCAEYLLLNKAGQALILGEHLLTTLTPERLQENIRQCAQVLIPLLSGDEELAGALAALREGVSPDTLLRRTLSRLQDWLSSRQRFIRSQGNSQAAVEQLLQRMRHAPDFPALSQTIQALQRADRSESERLQALSAIILKDFALTNKLLKVVNTAALGQQGISTVSRAIVILGFDAIRNLALSLLLFEHLHNRQQASDVRDLAIKALFSALIARLLARQGGLREGEEALICGMFQPLGELLCANYLREPYRQIQQDIAAGVGEMQSCRERLGVDYPALGRAIAQHWGFPERMLHTLEPLPEGQVRQPQNPDARLHALAALAGEMTTALLSPPSLQREKLHALRLRYQRAWPLEMAAMQELVAEARGQLQRYLSEQGQDAGHGPLAQRLTGSEVEAPPAASTVSAPEPLSTPETAQPTVLLSAGIQDITSTLLGNFDLNDLMRMILETMYRAVGFDHVLLCTRVGQGAVLQGRMGFGPRLETLLQGFRIDLDGSDSLFRMVMERNSDVLIEDIDAPSIAEHIPAWYRRLAPARTFLLLPMVLDKRRVGLFYGDRLQAGTLRIPPEQLNLLKTLRNQALLALRTQR